MGIILITLFINESLQIQHEPGDDDDNDGDTIFSFFFFVS